jgi:hypothetical protein
MKKELRTTLIFGLVQLLLSFAIWGKFEYSILSGDMVQGSEVSFWTFVLENRLAYYVGFSIVNIVIFGLLSIKFGTVFHPGFFGAVAMAIGTVILAVALSLNSVFRVPYPFVGVVAFLVTATVYGVISSVAFARK